VQRRNERRHFGHLIAEQIADQVRLVHAEVAHGAHDRLRLVEEPAVPAVDAPRFRSRMAEGRAERQHPAEHAGIENFLRLHVRRHQALVVGDHEEDAVLARGIDHRLRLFAASRHRLLDEHVGAGFRRRDRRGRVQMIRQADADRIRFLGGQQLPVIRVGASAVFLRVFLRPLDDNVAERDELDVRIRRIFGDVAMFRNRSAAEDGHLDFGHVRHSLFLKRFATDTILSRFRRPG
jgi:hypothetical protein